MSDNRERILPEDSLRLWFALLAGPLAWSAHLLLSYAAVPIACDRGWSFLLIVITAATGLVSLLGAVVSQRLTPRAESDAGDFRRSNAVDRMQFVSYAGFASGIFFAIVIVVEGLPIFFIDPCTWG